MSEWRTIDSAPRDGTKVLVCYRHPDKRSWVYRIAVAEELKVGTGTQVRWLSFESRARIAPTHWMRLPSSPTNGEENE